MITSFLLAFVATAIAGVAGRVAVRVARLSAGLGGGLPVLLASLVACAAASSLAAFLGARFSAQGYPLVHAALIAAALLLAKLDIAFLRAGKAPAEPTRSFGAILLVLVVSQLFSAASLCVFAVAAGSGHPWPAAAGGVAGAGAALAIAWRTGGSFEERLPLARIRWGAVGAFIGAALVIGLSGDGFIR